MRTCTASISAPFVKLFAASSVFIIAGVVGSCRDAAPPFSARPRSMTSLHRASRSSAQSSSAQHRSKVVHPRESYVRLHFEPAGSSVIRMTVVRLCAYLSESGDGRLRERAGQMQGR